MAGNKCWPCGLAIAALTLVRLAWGQEPAGKQDPKGTGPDRSAKAPTPKAEPADAKPSKGSADFEIARDSKKPWEDRFEAASRLNEKELKVLQKLLLGRIKNNYTKEALDDTGLLGKIGDEETAKGLERIWNEQAESGIDAPGKINAARGIAIEKIWQRLKKTPAGMGKYPPPTTPPPRAP